MIMESFVNNILMLMSLRLNYRAHYEPVNLRSEMLSAEDSFQIAINAKDAIATYEAVVMGTIL